MVVSPLPNVLIVSVVSPLVAATCVLLKLEFRFQGQHIRRTSDAAGCTRRVFQVSLRSEPWNEPALVATAAFPRKFAEVCARECLTLCLQNAPA